MSIEENVEKVLEEITAAARAAGREPGGGYPLRSYQDE